MSSERSSDQTCKRPGRTINQVCWKSVKKSETCFMSGFHAGNPRTSLTLRVNDHSLTLKWQSGELVQFKVVSPSDWCILCLCAVKGEARSPWRQHSNIINPDIISRWTCKKPCQMSHPFEMWAGLMCCFHASRCCKKFDGPAKSPWMAKWIACVKECHLNTCVSHRKAFPPCANSWKPMELML